MRTLDKFHRTRYSKCRSRACAASPAAGTVAHTASKTDTSTVHALTEEFTVTHNAVWSNPNTIGLVRRTECQNPTRHSFVAKWTLCALTWRVHKKVPYASLSVGELCRLRYPVYANDAIAKGELSYAKTLIGIHLADVCGGCVDCVVCTDVRGRLDVMSNGSESTVQLYPPLSFSGS